MRISNLLKRIVEYSVLTLASLGWTLLSCVRSRRINLGTVRKVLVIPHPGIGNLILLTPTLQAIRHQFPNSQISVVVDQSGCGEVFRDAAALVQETLVFDFARESLGGLWRFWSRHQVRNFDVAFSCWGFLHALLAWLSGARTRIGFQYKLGFHSRSGFLLTTAIPIDHRKHEVKQYLDLLKPLGIEVAEPEIFFPLSSDDGEKADEMLRPELGGMEIRPLIGLHIGSNENLATKRWPPELFAGLLDRISADHPSAEFILVGGKNETDYAQRFVTNCRVRVTNFVGRMTLRDTAAVIRRCDLFISNDSGPMHIAAAVKTPVIGIFGPTVHWKNAPWGDPRRCIVVRKDIPCSPCYVPYSARLSCSDPRCLRELTVDDVYKKVRLVLKESTCS